MGADRSCFSRASGHARTDGRIVRSSSECSINLYESDLHCSGLFTCGLTETQGNARPCCTNGAVAHTRSASAANPQVEAAVKAFQTIGADTNRLEAFCELMQTEEENAEKAAPSAEAKMNKCLLSLGQISKQLGRPSKIPTQHPRTAKNFLLH